MILYISLSIFVVALGFFVSCGQNTECGKIRQQNMANLNIVPAGISRGQAMDYGALLVIFMALFAVSALRVGVGNDYWGYRDSFLLIAQNRHVSSEFGFNAVVKLWQALALKDDSYLPIFAFFSFGTVFFFVKTLYRQSSWFVMSLFLFMMSGFYFQSLNTVRYYFALSIAVYSMEYVIKKDWVLFVLWIVFAACFHKSVLVVLLLYPLARYSWKKVHGILAFVVCASLILFKDVYRAIIFRFYPYYENSVFDTGSTSLVNIAKCAAVIFLGILLWKAQNEEKERIRFYFYCNLGALLLYVFASFVPEISRIGYYLTFTQVLLIPDLIKMIKNIWFKRIVTIGVVGCFLVYFALFLRGAQESIRILPYFNIIFN